MKLLVLTFLILGLVVSGLAVRILVVKNGQFKGTCGSNNPHLQEEGTGCSFCGAKPTRTVKIANAQIGF